MTSRAAWEAVADFWPRAATSQFVRAAELDFHVQVSGSGDDVLMLHGAGASSHSFAELAERLSTHYRVIAPDLPGQGFSSLLPTEAVGLVPFANYLESLLTDPRRRPPLGDRAFGGGRTGRPIRTAHCLAPRSDALHQRRLQPLRGGRRTHF